MTKFIKNYLIFIIKSLTVIFIISLIGITLSTLNDRSGKMNGTTKLVIRNLTHNYYSIQKNIIHNIYSKIESRNTIKNNTDHHKKENDKVFVMKFYGGTQAREIDLLKNEITAVLSVANKGDKVVLILESPGGTVNGYGLAASELERIRTKGINLTILVDKVAASGGYMMAVIGNEIIAAPFAIIGSIGVLAEMPNFSERLQREGIKYEQIMSGKYKKNINMFGKNTEEGRKKMQEDLNMIHSTFIELVKNKRPNINIQKIATGEFWLATQAKKLGLIDKIMTSEDYLTSLYADNKKVFLVQYEKESSLVSKVLNTFNVLYKLFNQTHISMAKQENSFNFMKSIHSIN